MHPAKKNLRIKLRALLNFRHTIKIALCVKYANSPKLGSNATKLALDFSFYLKMKKKTAIGIVGMTESIEWRIFFFFWPLVIEM